MKILAIDTTAKTASVAITDNGKLISEFNINTNTHSTTLLPMINETLRLNGLNVSDIGMLAVSVGPGSFTGIRIGVSTAKGLAFADNIPCVGVSTLEAMAMNLTGVNGIIIPLINARNSMVYTAMFTSDGKELPKRISEDSQVTISELVEVLKDTDRKLYITGDACSLVASAFAEIGREVITPERLKAQSAYGVALDAEKIWNSAEDKTIFTEAVLAPLYLKKTQAEREREEKLKNERNDRHEQ